MTFDCGNGKFNYRVAGVIIRNDTILLHVQNWSEFRTLPGGRCEFNESSRDAIQREIREELGTDCRVERLLWIVENFFRHEEKRFHELSFYYKINLPETCPYCSIKTFELKDGDTHMQFEWFPIAQIPLIAVKPGFLGKGLIDLPERPEHIIHSDY